MESASAIAGTLRSLLDQAEHGGFYNLAFLLDVARCEAEKAAHHLSHASSIPAGSSRPNRLG